jgi:hypothetical protein
MPQRDDKVGVHFGRIGQATWDGIKDQPGAIIEKAVRLLVEARKQNRTVHYPAPLKTGIAKKVWLTPETAAILDALSDETGHRRTALILAGLDLYFAIAPSGEGADPAQGPTGSR